LAGAAFFAAGFASGAAAAFFAPETFGSGETATGIGSSWAAAARFMKNMKPPPKTARTTPAIASRRTCGLI
jgi:hypothetical protein